MQVKRTFTLWPFKLLRQRVAYLNIAMTRLSISTCMTSVYIPSTIGTSQSMDGHMSSLFRHLDGSRPSAAQVTASYILTVLFAILNLSQSRPGVTQFAISLLHASCTGGQKMEKGVLKHEKYYNKNT